MVWRRRALGSNPVGRNPDDDSTLVLTDDERAERIRIIFALSGANYNVTRVAAQLRLSRRTLMARIDRYRIPLPAP